MLYVVATPIGNLEDITYRAMRIIKDADVLVCEDTRVTARLLAHAGIKKKMIAVNAANEERKTPEVIAYLEKGKTVALVSDAGTPSISDPGVRLVAAVSRKGIPVAPVPGPSAVAAALSIAGIPASSFLFEGFLPQKKGRQKKLKELAEEARTIILYESPYRIRKLLDECSEYMPERIMVICRELTKKFEETLRGTPVVLREHFEENEPKGEFVVLLAPKDWTEETE